MGYESFLWKKLYFIKTIADLIAKIYIKDTQIKHDEESAFVQPRRRSVTGSVIVIRGGIFSVRLADTIKQNGKAH